MEHTKWEFDEVNGSIFHFDQQYQADCRIADIPDYKTDPEYADEQKAIGHLIAVAPELLAACKRFKKIFISDCGNTSWMANYSDMEQAIAKAQ